MACDPCTCKCGPKCDCDCVCKDKSTVIWMKDADLEWPSFSKMYTETQIIIKFTISNSKGFTQTYTSQQTVLEILDNLERIFGIPKEHLQLAYRESPLTDEDKLLRDIDPDQPKILELNISTDDPSNWIIDIEKVYKDIVVPDIITVTVENGEDRKQIVVEVENKAIHKPTLGGYMHSRTGVLYLHSYTQTGPPPSKIPPENKNHRDTQTYSTRNRKVQMDYAHATQMTNTQIYIPNVTDKILTAGAYETAEERDKRLDIEGKVRTIQRYFRAWKMSQALKELSWEYHKRLQLELEADERERVEDEERRRQDLVSKVFPLTMSDFAMLYAMVNKWKRSEIARITSLHCGASKIAELYLLLEKEIEMLRAIEKLKNKVEKDLEYKRIQNFFKKIGEPIDWYSRYKSLHIFMDTLETQKGRQYFELYKKLTKNDLTTEQKLNVYLEVKQYIQDHQCHDSELLNGLIDRVCQLLARGVSEKQLKGLEKRIEAGVLHHFKLIECNENVTRHLLNKEELRMEKNLQYCPRCQKFKTIEDFKLTARTEKLRICRTCKWLDKADEPWVDLSPYRFILKQIRNYERLHHAVTSVVFILQDIDIHHITVQIWHGHSALSECNDIYQLRLVRWDMHKEWAPWNCILLTAEEAKAHLKVTSLDQVYEEEFINHVTNKHLLARRHFPQLKTFDKFFTKMANGDIRLDENSEYYNKPKMECLEIEDIEYCNRLLCKQGI
ncbi:unnamed protein product [Diabrotica balteata]|uniref:IQ motif and ubiquitin-like domain-containing protein n=1 Tax=Diabrotica balteata TaxID=107213 RepID=A0A9N9T0T8_DIABA|nr:unnamed protein product [Diabrotica balteata]